MQIDTQQLLKRYTTPVKVRSSNDTYINAFVDGINHSRHVENNIARERMKLDPNLKLKLWPRVDPRGVAIRIAEFCPTEADKHFLLKRCEQATNFSQCFFGLTKTK